MISLSGFNNMVFLSSDNESQSVSSSNLEKKEVKTYNEYNKFRVYDSLWDLNGMDEKEILTQIEREREAWNQKIESKGSSFNIPFNNENKMNFTHEKKRDKLNMKIEKINREINDIISEKELNKKNNENPNDSKKSSLKSNESKKQRYPF